MMTATITAMTMRAMAQPGKPLSFLPPPRELPAVAAVVEPNEVVVDASVAAVLVDSAELYRGEANGTKETRGRDVRGSSDGRCDGCLSGGR